MGWCESRVYVVPGRWDITVTESEHPNVSGGILYSLGTERVTESTAERIDPKILCQWLHKQSFIIRDQGLFSNANLGGYFSSNREDILVDAFFQDDEVSSLCLEFSLSRNSPIRCTVWNDFVTLLCSEWPVSLFDYDARQKVGPDRFLDILIATPEWKEFSARLHWENPTA